MAWFCMIRIISGPEIKHTELYIFILLSSLPKPEIMLVKQIIRTGNM
jgi:hypothetical protein